MSRKTVTTTTYSVSRGEIVAMVADFFRKKYGIEVPVVNISDEIESNLAWGDTEIFRFRGMSFTKREISDD